MDKMASPSPASVLFALSKRRSTSSPQLHCEATDFSSITGIPNSTSTSTSSWSESNNITSVDRKSLRINHVTQVSVHEPNHRTIPQDINPVVKPKKSTLIQFQTRSVAGGQESPSNVRQEIKPDSDLLCCNETIHYLQGSDSDSETSPSTRRKSHATIKINNGAHTSQKLKRFSKKASQIFSKLKLDVKEKDRKKEAENKSADESDSEDIQPIMRRHSQSLTSKVRKRFGMDASRKNSQKVEVVQMTEQSAGKGKHKIKQKIQGAKRSSPSHRRRKSRQSPLVNFAKFDPEKYPIECTEEIERAVREKEIEEGIAVSGMDMNVPVSPGAASVPNNMLACLTMPAEIPVSSSDEASAATSSSYQMIGSTPTHTTEDIYDLFGSLTPSGTYIPRTVHTQIDYMHCLVPDQWNIMKAPCYWGKIDRYEADQLLDNKPEGTFLLRDSAQEEFLFSVSFCRYGRTLHARIEQWNHKFSFDAHDPGVYSSDTICNLLEHYKDPNYCMFFEPMLTNPLPRVNPSSLMELSRARICQHVSYDTISFLKLPNSLKEFLREYHYKQRVRIRRRVEVDQGNWRDMPQLSAASIVTNTCISR